jgi:hypothetical protein
LSGRLITIVDGVIVIVLVGVGVVIVVVCRDAEVVFIEVV